MVSLGFWDQGWRQEDEMSIKTRGVTFIAIRKATSTHEKGNGKTAAI